MTISLRNNTRRQGTEKKKLADQRQRVEQVPERTWSCRRISKKEQCVRYNGVFVTFVETSSYVPWISVCAYAAVTPPLSDGNGRKWKGTTQTQNEVEWKREDARGAFVWSQWKFDGHCARALSRISGQCLLDIRQGSPATVSLDEVLFSTILTRQSHLLPFWTLFTGQLTF